MRTLFAATVTHQLGLTVNTLLSMGWRLPRNMWTMRPCSCFCIESPTTSSRVLVLCRCCSTCKPRLLGLTRQRRHTAVWRCVSAYDELHWRHSGAMTSSALYWW